MHLFSIYVYLICCLTASCIETNTIIDAWVCASVHCSLRYPVMTYISLRIIRILSQSNNELIKRKFHPWLSYAATVYKEKLLTRVGSAFRLPTS